MNESNVHSRSGYIENSPIDSYVFLRNLRSLKKLLIKLIQSSTIGL